jgi:hypothetical protein
MVRQHGMKPNMALMGKGKERKSRRPISQYLSCYIHCLKAKERYYSICQKSASVGTKM